MTPLERAETTLRQAVRANLARSDDLEGAGGAAERSAFLDQARGLMAAAAPKARAQFEAKLRVANASRADAVPAGDWRVERELLNAQLEQLEQDLRAGVGHPGETVQAIMLLRARISAGNLAAQPAVEFEGPRVETQIPAWPRQEKPKAIQHGPDFPGARRPQYIEARRPEPARRKQGITARQLEAQPHMQASLAAFWGSPDWREAADGQIRSYGKNAVKASRAPGVLGLVLVTGVAMLAAGIFRAYPVMKGPIMGLSHIVKGPINALHTLFMTLRKTLG